MAAIFGLWLGVNTLTQMRQRTVLQHDGRVAVGKVATRWARGRTSVLYARYTFVVDGNAYSGEQMVPDYLFASLKTSDHFLVRYFPRNPAINYPDGWERPLPLSPGSITLMVSIAAFGVS
jgi:hypothetical protein